jgi:hypothetical protein
VYLGFLWCMYARDELDCPGCASMPALVQSTIVLRWLLKLQGALSRIQAVILYPFVSLFIIIIQFSTFPHVALNVDQHLVQTLSNQVCILSSCAIPSCLGYHFVVTVFGDDGGSTSLLFPSPGPGLSLVVVGNLVEIVLRSMRHQHNTLLD